MSVVARALLRVDTTAPVAVNSLAALSPGELAVASLRPDLPTLVRQRAHLEFLLRRSSYRKSDKRGSQEQPLLDHPLDFALPDSPSALSIEQLVLVQFNRQCASLDWADKATQLFLSRASEGEGKAARAERTRREGYTVRRCEMSCDGGAWVDEEGIVLAVEPEALVVRRGQEVLFAVGTQDLTGARSFVSRRGDEVEREGLEVSAQQVALVASAMTVTDVKIVFELAPSGDNGPLLAAVATWKRAGGFHVSCPEPVNDQQVGPSSALSTRRPPPPPPPHPAPRSRSTTTSSTSTVNRQRSTSGIVSPWAAPGSGADGYGRAQNARSVESLREERDRVGPWQFLDDVPEHADWHPGDISRQMALLRAIAPDEPLKFVAFTLDDLALLSHRSLYKSLPRLPDNPPDCAPGVKHVAVERLALEHIYRFGTRLNLSAERLVLLTSAYPDLKRYVHTSAKVIAARDALVVAYTRVLADLDRRVSGQQASDPREPLNKLVDLVRGMHSRQNYRSDVVYDKKGRLIRSAAQTVSEAQLGKGIYARFERALGEIVRDEDRAGSIG
ncbi:hypothetical protein JCM8208_003857 [Rhodotorula glutinis]